MFIEKHGKKFKEYIFFKEENNDILSQPHIVSADPPMKIPNGIQRLANAFKNSREVPIGKEVDPKGGEKNITMKSKKLFIVGGAVRDYLLGHTPHNYNLVTDAHPEEVEKIMRNTKPPIIVTRVNTSEGFVNVVVDSESYKIETMRREDENGDIVFTTDPNEDAKRRDLTINALFYDIVGKKIYDYTGGIRHLKDGKIKFIGRIDNKIKNNGKYRYAHILNKVPNAEIDNDIKIAIHKNMEVGDDDMPPEKIREEFWKGLEDLHSDAKKYLKTYLDLGLLYSVFPGLELSFEFPECKTCKSRPIVLASLLKNNHPKRLAEQLRKLKYTDREIKDAVFLINLLIFKPEYIYEFKKELLRTNLTKRQIMDWAKINDLDTELMDKMINHELSLTF